MKKNVFVLVLLSAFVVCNASSCRICNSAVMNISICNAEQYYSAFTDISVAFYFSHYKCLYSPLPKL
jgi:hypothetical protein